MSSLNEVLENLRVSYQSASLDIKDCLQNPEDQFDKWFTEASMAKCDEPNAFVLSTVSNNQPHGRVVLLKGVNNGEYIFYSNYSSAKGREIDHNSNVSATFLWLPLHRQVRIEGSITKIDISKSDDYFHKRPRGSQLGAIASPQSEKISSRAELEKMFSDTERKFAHLTELPRPSHWGGYAIKPTYFEFWQGRDNRMHDRLVYIKEESGWTLKRLAP